MRKPKRQNKSFEDWYNELDDYIFSYFGEYLETIKSYNTDVVPDNYFYLMYENNMSYEEVAEDLDNILLN